MIYNEEGESVYTTETVYDDETGLPRRQITTLNGLKHAPPDGSPSQVAFDREGRATEKIWHAFGEEHRLDGPAAIVLFPETGVHMTEDFMIKGHPRPSGQGPCRIRRNELGEVWQQEFSSEENPSPENPNRDLSL